MASGGVTGTPAAPYADYCVSRLSRRFGRRLERILLKRTEYNNELRCRDKCLDYMRQDTARIQSDGGRKDTSEDQINDNKLRNQPDENNHNLQSHEKKLTTIRNDLSSMEYRLWGVEKSMRKVFDHVTQQSTKSGQSSNSFDLDPSDISSETSSNGETLTLLADYYEHRGRAAICTGRLQELEMEYSRSMIQRDLLRDQEQVLEKPDEQSEKEYDAQRQAIITDLERARENVELSASRCVEAGLDTNASGRLQSREAADHAFDNLISVITTPLEARNPLARIGGWIQATSSPGLHKEVFHRSQNVSDSAPRSLLLRADRPTMELHESGRLSAPTASAEQIRSFAKSLHALQGLRDSVLECRTTLSHELSKEEDHERFTKESLEELMSTVQGVSSADHWVTEKQTMEELARRWLADVDAHETQRDTTKKVRERLSNLEFNLKSCEEKFAAVVQSIGSVLGISNEAVELVSPESSVNASSAADVPTLVAELYDRQGDVGIYRERLDELEYQYNEDKVQRDFLADQGQPPFETDNAFESKYIRRKEKICSQLHEAEADVKRLEVQCRQAGHSVEQPMHTATTLSDIDESETSIKAKDRSQHLLDSLVEQDRRTFDPWPLTSDLIAQRRQGSADRNDRQSALIGAWLQNVTPEDIVHEGPSLSRQHPIHQ